MNVESADSAGVESLTLALSIGVVELVALAFGQHACGAVEIWEVGALQRLGEVNRDDAGDGAYEDEHSEGFCMGDERPGNCVRGKHAAVYRRLAGSATGVGLGKALPVGA